MPSNDRDKACKEIFDLLVEALKIKLATCEDVEWAKVAMAFLKQNGDFTQLPVPGSAIDSLKNSLPFKKQA